MWSKSNNPNKSDRNQAASFWMEGPAIFDTDSKNSSEGTQRAVKSKRGQIGFESGVYRSIHTEHTRTIRNTMAEKEGEERR